MTSLDRFRAPNLTRFPLIFQILLGLVLQPSDVLHRQLDPLVDGAEELSVEVGEQPPLGVHGVLLHLVLQTHPLELDGDQFVGCHHRLDGLRPLAFQRPSAAFRLELGGVFVGLVVAVQDRIVGDVDADDFALGELLFGQLVNVFRIAAVGHVIRLNLQYKIPI